MATLILQIHHYLLNSNLKPQRPLVTKKKNQFPNTSINNVISSLLSTTTPLPTTSTAKSIDNNPVSTVLATYDTSNGSLPLSGHSIKPTAIHTNTNINFTSVTPTESTLSREQAIIFNSIDGISQ